MPRGDSQELIVKLIPSSPVAPSRAIPLAPSIVDDCCFELPIFGAVSDTDPFKNDRTGFIRKYDRLITGVSIVIQKYENGSFVDKHTITDNSYGTFSDFGVFEANGFKYISVYIDWRLVLIGFDAGSYRLKTIEVNSLASTADQNDYSEEYCLREFRADLADGTVVFDTVLSGTLGDIKDRSKVFEYPSGWKDSIRIPAKFGKNKSSYEQEYTEYRNGAKVFIKDVQTESFVLEIFLVPASVHDFMKTRIFQANNIYVTDYNTNNANIHVSTKIIKPDSYEPRWGIRTKMAPCVVEFEDAYNNKRHRNC